MSCPNCGDCSAIPGGPDYNCPTYHPTDEGMRRSEPVGWQWRVFLTHSDGSFWSKWIDGQIEIDAWRKEYAIGISSGKIEVRELYAIPSAP
jgi:hypothetical protein